MEEENEGPNVEAVDPDHVNLQYLSLSNASSMSSYESSSISYRHGIESLNDISINHERVDPAVQEWAERNGLNPGIVRILIMEGYTTLDEIKELDAEAVDRLELKHRDIKGKWFNDLKKARQDLIQVEPGFKEWLMASNLTDETVKVLLEQNYTTKDSLQPLADPENMSRCLPKLKAQQQNKLIDIICIDILDRIVAKDELFCRWITENVITRETALVLIRDGRVGGYNDVMSLKCQDIDCLRDKIATSQMERLKKAILKRSYEQCGDEFKIFLQNAKLTEETKLRIVEKKFTTVDSLKILRKPDELPKHFVGLQAEQFQFLDKAIKLKFYIPGLKWEHGDLHLMVVGKTGVGKSETCNTILGAKKFIASSSLSSHTSSSQLERSESGNVYITDSIGLEDTRYKTFEVVKWLVKAIFGMKPASGPNVILYLVDCNRFTVNDFALYQFVMSMFGEGVVEHMIIIFTHADKAGKAPKDYLKTCPRNLHNIITSCQQRCVFFDNTPDGMNVQQIEELKRQIEKLPKHPTGALQNYNLEIPGRAKDELDKLWLQMRGKVRWGNVLEGREQVLHMLDMTSTVETQKVLGDLFDQVAKALGKMRSLALSMDVEDGVFPVGYVASA